MDIHALFLILENIKPFTAEFDVNFKVFFLNDLNQLKEVLFYSWFAELFLMNEHWILWNAFSAFLIIWIFFFFILIWWISLSFFFSQVKPNLHCQDKLYFGHDVLHVFQKLFVDCYHFVKDFCIYVYNMCWSTALFSCDTFDTDSWYLLSIIIMSQ